MLCVVLTLDQLLQLVVASRENVLKCEAETLVAEEEIRRLLGEMHTEVKKAAKGMATTEKGIRDAVIRRQSFGEAFHSESESYAGALPFQRSQEELLLNHLCTQKREVPVDASSGAGNVPVDFQSFSNRSTSHLVGSTGADGIPCDASVRDGKGDVKVLCVELMGCGANNGLYYLQPGITSYGRPVYKSKNCYIRSNLRQFSQSRMNSVEVVPKYLYHRLCQDKQGKQDPVSRWYLGFMVGATTGVAYTEDDAHVPWKICAPWKVYIREAWKEVAEMCVMPADGSVAMVAREALDAATKKRDADMKMKNLDSDELDKAATVFLTMAEHMFSTFDVDGGGSIDKKELRLGLGLGLGLGLELGLRLELGLVRCI